MIPVPVYAEAGVQQRSCRTFPDYVTTCWLYNLYMYIRDGVDYFEK